MRDLGKFNAGIIRGSIGGSGRGGIARLTTAKAFNVLQTARLLLARHSLFPNLNDVSPTSNSRSRP